MTNTKGKRIGTNYMFLRLLRKHGVVSWATYVEIYKKDGIVNIQGMGTHPTNVTMAKLEEPTVSPSLLLASS